MVEDSVVPLLRIEPIKGKHGDLVSKSFDNVQYEFETVLEIYRSRNVIYDY